MTERSSPRVHGIARGYGPNLYQFARTLEGKSFIWAADARMAILHPRIAVN